GTARIAALPPFEWRPVTDGYDPEPDEAHRGVSWRCRDGGRDRTRARHAVRPAEDSVDCGALAGARGTHPGRAPRGLAGVPTSRVGGMPLRRVRGAGPPVGHFEERRRARRGTTVPQWRGIRRPTEVPRRSGTGAGATGASPGDAAPQGQGWAGAGQRRAA